MENTKKYFLFLFIYGLLIASLYILKLGGNYFVEIVKIVNYITALIALFFGYLSIRYFGLKNLQGKSIFFVSLAVLAWLIGDFIWDMSGDA